MLREVLLEHSREGIFWLIRGIHYLCVCYSLHVKFVEKDFQAGLVALLRDAKTHLNTLAILVSCYRNQSILETVVADASLKVA